MTDNPNVSTYVAEALKLAQLLISVKFYTDDEYWGAWYCLETYEGDEGSDGKWYDCEPQEITARYIIERTRLLREQQQVK